MFLFIESLSYILISRNVLSLSSPFFLIKLSELEQARIIVLRLLFLFNSLLSYGQTARHHEEGVGGGGGRGQNYPRLPPPRERDNCPSNFTVLKLVCLFC